MKRRTVKVEVHGARPPVFGDFVERYHEHHARIEAPVWYRKRPTFRDTAAVTGTLRLICLGYLRPIWTIDTPEVYLEDLEPRRRLGKRAGDPTKRMVNPIYLSPKELSILVRVVGYDLEFGQISRKDATRRDTRSIAAVEVDRGLAPELTDPTGDELGRYGRGAVAELVRRLGIGDVLAVLGASEGVVRFSFEPQRPTARVWGCLAVIDPAKARDYLEQIDGRLPMRFPTRRVWDHYLTRAGQGFDMTDKTTAWYHQ